MGLLLVLAILPGQVFGQAVEIANSKIGFEGHFKLGFWTEVSASVTSRTDQSGFLEVLAPDGEGAEITYRFPGNDQPIELRAEQPQTIRGLIRVGRLNSLLKLRWVDEEGQQIGDDSTLDTSAGGMSSTDELLVGLGRQEFFEGVISRIKVDGREMAQIELEDAGEFPANWIAWEAVDSLILMTDQPQQYEQLRPDQAVALEKWLKMGGQIYLSLTPQAITMLDGDGWLNRLMPGAFENFVDHGESTGFESYAQASEQLLSDQNATISIAKVSAVDGTVEAYEGRSESDLPLVVRSPKGFGRIVLITFDLNETQFVDWQGRDRFVVNIFRPDGVRSESRINEQGSGRVTHIGYTDLAGQLRSAMDQFQEVYFVSFTWIAVLVVLFIICIGPLDYFLLKKLLRRMELTWISFPCFVVLFSALAFYGVRLTKVDEIRVNQVELIDIDQESGIARGIVWDTVYSPRSMRLDLSLANDSNDSIVEVEDRMFTWQGLPGIGLGGMDTSLTTAIGSDGYRCRVESKQGSPVQDGPVQDGPVQDGPVQKSTGQDSVDKTNGLTAAGSEFSLDGVPLPVASTKTFVGRWNGTARSSMQTNLVVDRGSDSLYGSITNTLDVELTDVVILYGSWAYEVERDVAPGAQFQIESDTRERTLEGYLTRRQIIDGRDVTSPWNATSTDLRRILEMYSFHERVGGSSYTGLSQRVHPYLDISRQLTDDRAVLIARAKTRYCGLQVNREPLDKEFDTQLTVYRIILPVRDPSMRAKP